ncbi:cysteine desulfurase family protein [Novosphingobium aquimarinum]|uniref:cysteine desulfurase family protein n=1 Tax=Novosphingobium aquimarinum TaxID=2682494 RepID=UPI0012EBB3DA|nr:aminotransferase class V-fold PLP-dependent enzyme [Novosphingobium aquimarinum]
MTAKPLYLDHAATAPLRDAARRAMLEGFECWANPSSPHRAGRAARAALEDARERVRAALDWRGELVFTSGASEAIALGLGQSRRPLAAVSAVEHDAVLRVAGAAERIAVAGDGRIGGADDAARSGLVAVQHVNSETGVIQDLTAIGDAIRQAGGVLFADCAQSAGKLPLPDADMIACSAHKFGGPIGVGALLVRDWSLLHPGGGQERGYRGGTENLPGVLAMAAALEAGNDWLGEATRLRAMLDDAIRDAGGEVVAPDAPRCPTIGAVRMPGVAAAVQLIRFDSAGIAVSAGSACSSGSMRPSHVLAAMGLDEKAASEVIRVSIGPETREADILRFLENWREMAGSPKARA